MANVTLDGVTKRYEDVTAVDDMNMEIGDGEFVTFVGPSGCGKSTTMETIAGLTKPTEGHVYIGERDVTNLPPKDRGIAMVFQNIALFPHMDVYDNISFGLRIRNHEKSDIDRRVEEAAEIVQLDGMMHRMPEEMSGGQRQRVAIARALVREPDVFLMDEPLANLDAKLRVHMRTELQRLHRRLDTTIIYVTHDQAEAMTMSDRIAVINAGKLQQIAPPLTCYNEPANRFVAGFIGSPSMNFVDAEVTNDGLESENFTIEFDPSTTDGLAPGDRVTVGVRPEDVYLERTADGVEHPTGLIDARTDVLEPMGNEVFVYLVTGDDTETSMEIEGGATTDDQLLMSVDPDTRIDVDEDVEVVLDRSRIHLFDYETGDALRHGLVDIASAGSGTPERGVGDSD
ncbi:ABC transporter ATP-binding protein [Halalkalicoccus jeotgali]|uniref:ABC-type D-xylose/L-arabinose transporter n=1 Tax=Halalkalicoccus jeotgali (strain DSM 18796 / CECT 7217 / JCM 14584 / KCTC 4019 / B3) TaxID=795797 RepID=D8JAV3_HALJB|nr:ABC transporter ATP-binding protein [Halalkalicoccus jeotgali]ADJ14825.1 ABC transporter related protein [Halalkalicoccus jeotgali B3]ELY39408.1 ABC transporter-like protein [Halalkalicoccus jeotgali B3]